MGRIEIPSIMLLARASLWVPVLVLGCSGIADLGGLPRPPSGTGSSGGAADAGSPSGGGAVGSGGTATGGHASSGGVSAGGASGASGSASSGSGGAGSSGGTSPGGGGASGGSSGSGGGTAGSDGSSGAGGAGSGGAGSSATCGDHVRDGDETGVDCGGSCVACGFGQPCGTSADCAGTGPGCSASVGGCVCDPVSLICVPSYCTDGKHDADESDRDCGGSCAGCGPGAVCRTDSDCGGVAVGCGDRCYCDTATSTCVYNDCFDNKTDALETDFDCGGPLCHPCLLGAGCLVDTDCVSNACDLASHKCVADQCADHHVDGKESDVDCGGTCAGCAAGQKCHTNFDCSGGNYCNSMVCQ